MNTAKVEKIKEDISRIALAIQRIRHESKMPMKLASECAGLEVELITLIARIAGIGGQGGETPVPSEPKGL